MQPECIFLIRTGGTIDSKAYKDPRNAPKFVEPLKGAKSLIMRTIRDRLHYDHVDEFTFGRWREDQFVKDSQKFDEADIKDLAQIILADTDHRLFVLTHGTDHMAINAAMLQPYFKDSGKTVVFAGAMVPLAMHKKYGSDGIKNLDFAVANIASLPEGVHMIGHDKGVEPEFFNPTEVEKDKQQSKKDLRFVLRLKQASEDATPALKA